MRKPYSRLAKTEEKKNFKSAFIYVVLTIFAIVLIIVFGLPAMGRLSGFLNDLRSSGEPIGVNDNTPPAPPFLEDIPQYTNRPNIDIKGTTEPGVIVILQLNDNKREIIADTGGEFSYRFALNDGVNTVSAIAKDSSGNISQESKVYRVIVDLEPPELVVTEPEDGKSYYGAQQRQVIIRGQTEDDATVTVNDHLVVLESDGTFMFTSTLTEGDNNFHFKVVDRAGNVFEDGITLHFWL